MPCCGSTCGRREKSVALCLSRRIGRRPRPTGHGALGLPARLSPFCHTATRPLSSSIRKATVPPLRLEFASGDRDAGPSDDSPASRSALPLDTRPWPELGSFEAYLT